MQCQICHVTEVNKGVCAECWQKMLDDLAEHGSSSMLADADAAGFATYLTRSERDELGGEEDIPF